MLLALAGQATIVEIDSEDINNDGQKILLPINKGGADSSACIEKCLKRWRVSFYSYLLLLISRTQRNPT